jgi:uncharacterized membrane protein YphA (DoxX/SURF4 family)
MFKPSIPRLSLAMVWIYQGLWLKLLGNSPQHRAIFESVPYFAPPAAHTALALLGAGECAIGLWVLSARRPRTAAAVQTATLAAMNAGGILWAAREIPDIPGMLLLNFAFLTLAWTAAQPPQGASHAHR